MHLFFVLKRAQNLISENSIFLLFPGIINGVILTQALVVNIILLRKIATIYIFPK